MFPTPNKLLLEGMALAGYSAFANSISEDVDVHLRDWDEADTFVTDAWFETARAMYAMLAVASGATVTEIPESPED
tara:strand:- start:276 stop:503 length:228 start_codon:yes stop_codon:yes gene_type:complete